MLHFRQRSDMNELSPIPVSVLDLATIVEGETAADAFRRGQYGIGNLVWYPHEKVTVVGELQWGRRDNFRDGFSSEDVRIQFGFKYNFSKVFEL